MDRSAYLVQALQEMGQPAPAPQQQGPDLASLKKVGDARKAYEAANPGKSYMAHGFQQMGQNIMQAPGNIMAAPGNVMSGFGALAQRLKPGG